MRRLRATLAIQRPEDLWTRPSTPCSALRPDYDPPIPYMRRTREYYAAIGYTTPYRWAHYLAAPFTAAASSRSANPRLPSSPPPRLTSPTRATRGPARPTTAAPSSTRCIRATRRRTTTCASPISATTAPTPRRPTATPGSRCRRCAEPPPRAGSARVAPRFHGAPTNRSHRVTVETDAPEILARIRAGRRRRRRHRPQLPGLPPDQHAGRPPSGGERHPHRRDGLRQGHRRARRRAALPVQRFSARQQRRQAARHRRRRTRRWARAASAGDRPRSADHDAVAAALERRTASGSWIT